MRRALPLLLLISLAACGTPQERCINRETRDLRMLNRLITESEANLQRGYALEEVTVYHDRWTYCPSPRPPAPPPSANGQIAPPPPPPPQMCLREVAETITRPKSIDLNVEAAKLASMKEKSRALNRAAQGSIAQCKLQYPEKKKA